MKNIIFFIVILLTLIGCSSNVEMDKRFKGNEILLVTDVDGNSYIIEHHLGDMYTVKPIRKLQ